MTMRDLLHVEPGIQGTFIRQYVKKFKCNDDRNTILVQILFKIYM